MTAIPNAFRIESNRQSKSGPGGAGHTVAPGPDHYEGVAVFDHIPSVSRYIRSR